MPQANPNEHDLLDKLRAFFDDNGECANSLLKSRSTSVEPRNSRGCSVHKSFSID